METFSELDKKKIERIKKLEEELINARRGSKQMDLDIFNLKNQIEHLKWGVNKLEEKKETILGIPKFLKYQKKLKVLQGLGLTLTLFCFFSFIKSVSGNSLAFVSLLPVATISAVICLANYFIDTSEKRKLENNSNLNDLNDKIKEKKYEIFMRKNLLSSLTDKYKKSLIDNEAKRLLIRAVERNSQEVNKDEFPYQKEIQKESLQPGKAYNLQPISKR